MRDISVDKKGLSFSLSVLLVLFLFGGLAKYGTAIHRSVIAGDSQVASAVSATAHEETKTIRSPFDAYIDHDVKTVTIDIDEKEILLKTGDRLEHVFPIVSVPTPSSADGVETGTYTVDKKTKQKHSSITLVQFPYYVQFGDRYALHGKPTDAHGEELTDSFFGNKITLSTHDAEMVFDFVKTGTSIRVTSTRTDTEKNADEASVRYTELPATSAESYIIGNVETGEVYLSKQETDRYPIASITKLITATVATDVIGHRDVVTAPDGNEYTLSDLFYPLLLHSDNATALHITQHAGTQYFLSNMNAFVHALLMTDTSLYDASGLSPKNISTAKDLFTFANHLYSEKRYLFDISHEESTTITSTTGTTWDITNQNELAYDPHFLGGKLGYTDEAGQTSLAVFSVPIGTETQPIAVIVLQSHDWKQDTRTLLRWLVTQAQ
jgi:hypothetical protein